MGTGKQLAILPLFVRDYLSATRHFSLAERGAYTDLLFFQWEMGALPREPERLARLIGCSPEEFNSVWTVIRGKFVESGNGLVNARLEEHRRESVRLSEVRRLIGSRGGKKSAETRASKASANCEPIATPIAQAIAAPKVEAKSNSPSPSPSPSPESGISFGDTRPQRRTVPPFHQEVIIAYHELLPDLPAIKDWSERRRKKLEARIGERVAAGKAADVIKYWRDLFAKVAASDFLCGRKTDWRCPGLEWLLEPKNFTKLIEGAHDNHPRNGAGVTHAR